MPSIEPSSHFTQLRDWSERKHQVLKDYLPAFCRVLSRRAETIWYVDGYAGAGIYRDPNNPDAPGHPGSPVLAAKIIQTLPYPIRCINVEGDQENFGSLQRETAHFANVESIHGDFNAVIDQILSRVAEMPAFFFLDPFGTKDLPMEGLVDKIALRTKPTDILLRYATETVRRVAGAYEKDAKRGSAHGRNLDKWFRGQDWRTIIEQHTGDERDEALIRYYLKQLVTISNSRMRFACAYPIRSTEGLTKYHLVFATGDRLGMKVMSDILYKAEAKYVEEHAAYIEQKEAGKLKGQTMFDFANPHTEPSAADQLTAKIAKIEQSILDQRQHRTHWEFDDLCCTLIEHGWFARFSEKEFRDACKGLYAKGQIERVSAGKGWNKGTVFILR